MKYASTPAVDEEEMHHNWRKITLNMNGQRQIAFLISSTLVGSLAAIFRIDRMNRGYIGADFRDFRIFVMIERFIQPQPFYFYLDAKKTF